MNNSFLMTNSIVLGIMQFCARVAERQTRRSQKPLSKDVRVQIPPRAPLRMFKVCFSASLFLFSRSFDTSIRNVDECASGKFAPQSHFGKPETKMRLELQLFCDYGLPQGAKARISAQKRSKSTTKRPDSALRRQKGIRNRKKVAKTLEILFSRWAEGPNGRMSATNRSANETGPIPCLQNQQQPTGPDQGWGKWEGFALLYEQPGQGKNNTE